MNPKHIPAPQGYYCPATRNGQLIFTAGMTPRKDGQLILTGRVRSTVELQHYKEATCLAAENALNAAQSQLKEGERITQILSMTVFIAADEDFTQHPKLADFASHYLVNLLGEQAVSSRAAVGVKTLPADAPIEITLIAAAG